MSQAAFYESILDNIQDAVYVLDDKGNYIFVNSAYIKAINIPKTELLTYNVHKFLETGQIDMCVSDIVYREKRRVVMFQDVYGTQYHHREPKRFLIVSTPIFDEKGNVKNVVAVLKRLDQINDDYRDASLYSHVARFATGGTAQPGAGESYVIAESAAMQAVLQLAGGVAGADSNVLITGESGTGKEVVAQYIHTHSRRAGRPLVVINCASLPEALLEAELFGYEKGAFTGASSTGKAGLFESAGGGTLFLDEINSLPFSLQGKLLRAIETKNIQRIGATKGRPVDFRLLAASNEDLEALVAQNRFRADLFYRLNVIPIHIPPLRARREDIVPLTLHFLNYYCKKNNKTKTFSGHTLHKIMEYDWPGNVRELKNFVERSVVMSFDETIEINDVAAIVAKNAPPPGVAEGEGLFTPTGSAGQFAGMAQNGVSLEEYVSECERRYVEYALDNSKSTYEAAKLLRTSQASVMRRKKKFGL